MTRKLYLIRHAQSQANVDRDMLYDTPNMDAGLTGTGERQAQAMAEALAPLLEQESSIRIWVSPYRRTLDTAAALGKRLTRFEGGSAWSMTQSLYLAERQFGLVDTHRNFVHTHSAEHEHYRMHVDQGFGFWARPPLGESPFDVCLRIDFFLKAVLPPSGTHVIVSHGMALRAIQMMELSLPVEAYDSLANPNNASVRLLENAEDKGILLDVAAKEQGLCH